MNMQPEQTDDLLTPAEVAAILYVDPKTVTRWARAGKLDAIRTPGGHRRYLRTDVLAIMSGVHHSQQADPLMNGSMNERDAGSRFEVEGDISAAAADAEAIAVALEGAAWEAAEAVVLAAAAVAAAAEKAATAASRARAARRFATTQAALTAAGQVVLAAAAVQIPTQRQHEAPEA